MRWVGVDYKPITRDGARLIEAQKAIMRNERARAERLLDENEWNDGDPLEGPKAIISAGIAAILSVLVIIGAAAVVWVLANGGVRP